MLGLIGLFLLVMLWVASGLELRTKIIFTAIHLGLGVFYLLGDWGGWFAFVCHGIWCLVVAYLIYGHRFHRK